MTLAEFRAQLKAEGKLDDYLSRKAAADEEVRQREAEYARAEAPILDELRSAGIHVKSVWDLVNSSAAYDQALPILLAHLQKPYPDAIRDGLARALGVPAAKSMWPTLMKLYLSEPESRTKHGLAVALSNVADDDAVEYLIAAAKNPQHGESRIFLLSALARSRLPQAKTALAELQADPVLRKEILATTPQK